MIEQGGERAPSPCCSVRRVPSLEVPQHSVAAAPRRSTRGQVKLSGGAFQMGDAFGEGYADDGELPVHRVEVSPFHVDVAAVTNAQFAAFAKATGYVTDAERFETSAVFYSVVSAKAGDVYGPVPATPWWITVRGACWRHPEGPLSDVAQRQNHPVVHVSWRDSAAYAEWAGKRLPTEAEWEFAARGGLESRRFPWGDELGPGGRWRCNVWQGRFPNHNTAEDGHVTTAPVKAYRPNGLGLWNTSGNAWEWCADWFSSDYYATSPVRDPAGPTEGTTRVMRGGSYLCHDSYCHRYRLAARSSNTPDSSSANLGFRCANDA